MSNRTLISNNHSAYLSAPDSVRLVNEFNNMPVPSKPKHQGKLVCLHPDVLKFGFWFLIFLILLLMLFSVQFSAAGDKLVKDIRPGVPFEPTYIYRLLTLIKSSLSEKVGFLLRPRTQIENIMNFFLYVLSNLHSVNKMFFFIIAYDSFMIQIETI